jgi:hypothetical protein
MRQFYLSFPQLLKPEQKGYTVRSLFPNAELLTPNSPEKRKVLRLAIMIEALNYCIFQTLISRMNLFHGQLSDSYALAIDRYHRS